MIPMPVALENTIHQRPIGKALLHTGTIKLLPWSIARLSPSSETMLVLLLTSSHTVEERHRDMFVARISLLKTAFPVLPHSVVRLFSDFADMCDISLMS